jgi:hypothetical protein
MYNICLCDFTQILNLREQKKYFMCKCIEFAGWDRDRWRALVIAVMNLLLA